MKKNLQLFILLFVVGLTFSACKSKEKIVTLPSAQEEARSDAYDNNTVEEVRDEKFSFESAGDNGHALDKRYHVVVGSFKNRNNAQGLKRALDAEGNRTAIAVNEHGMYRVLIASFNKYQDARSKANEIKRRFPDVWILQQRQ